MAPSMAAKNPWTCGLRITGCVATLLAVLTLVTACESVHFSNVNVSIQVGFSDLMCYMRLRSDSKGNLILLEAPDLTGEIQRIIGNEYFFQLHLDEYNLKYGRENYTVSKILETEISHKVERHQDTIEEIVRKSRKASQLPVRK
nr:hypothetical protein CFP56_74111 [Quercus suber]